MSMSSARVALVVAGVVLVAALFAPLWWLQTKGVSTTGDRGYDNLVVYAKHLQGDRQFDAAAEKIVPSLLRRPLGDGRTLVGAPRDGGGCWVLLVGQGPIGQPTRGDDTDCLRPGEQLKDRELDGTVRPDDGELIIPGYTPEPSPAS